MIYDNIEIDDVIRNKFMNGFDRKEARIKTLVIHGTAGGGTYRWMKNRVSQNYKKGIGLFHYLIERDGHIREIIDPDRWVYHSHAGHRDSTTIGIEIINPNVFNRGHYTNSQYQSLFYMFDFLFNKYKTIDEIISHNMQRYRYTEKHKACPGEAFNWDRIKGYLLIENKIFEYEKEHYYNIEDTYAEKEK
jgi:N-acetyl-anhydromuramyl-L-alanine amidase AmpD